MHLLAWIENASNPIKAISGILLVAVVGSLNILTGWELDLSLFYILPIAFVTWFLGSMAGFFASFVCTAVWYGIDLSLLHEYSSEFVHYWNTVIRLLFFFLFTFMLNSLKNALERERKLSRIDSLTGVATSRHFYELLELEIARSKRYKRPFTIAYLDLDNFKAVNDRFGHTTGDKALRTITDYVQKNIRIMDVAGRLGGDEFAILFPETDQETIRIIISKLRKGLLEEMRQHGWPITFSIGVITCNGTYPSADDLIKSTDELMYTVKNTSKNDVRYETR